MYSILLVTFNRSGRTYAQLYSRNYFIFRVANPYYNFMIFWTSFLWLIPPLPKISTRAPKLLCLFLRVYVRVRVEVSRYRMNTKECRGIWRFEVRGKLERYEDRERSEGHENHEDLWRSVKVSEGWERFVKMYVRTCWHIDSNSRRLGWWLIEKMTTSTLVMISMSTLKLLSLIMNESRSSLPSLDLASWDASARLTRIARTGIVSMSRWDCIYLCGWYWYCWMVGWNRMFDASERSTRPRSFVRIQRFEFLDA